MTFVEYRRDSDYVEGGGRAEEDVEECEQQYDWRATQRDVFWGVAKYAPKGVKHLVLKTCPLKTTSVFGTNEMNKVAGLKSQLRQLRGDCTQL